MNRMITPWRTALLESAYENIDTTKRMLDLAEFLDVYRPAQIFNEYFEMLAKGGITRPHRQRLEHDGYYLFGFAS